MAKNGKRGALRLYKSYSFIDKDPVIDAVRTARSDAKASYTELSINSGVSVTTLRNWEHGKTRRPQFSTVSAVARALKKTGIKYGRDGKPSFID